MWLAVGGRVDLACDDIIKFLSYNKHMAYDYMPAVNIKYFDF